MQNYDYRESHKGAAKAELYDYGAHYGRYRSLVWAWEQQILKHVLKKYYTGRESYFLDFACGTGRIIGFLRNQVTTATGVDISESMVQVARQKLRNSEIILGDLTRGNILAGRQFNLITAFRFFLNAQPSLRKEAMQSLVNHLADDGYLVFNNHMQRWSIIHMLVWVWSLLRHGKVDTRCLSMGQIKDLLEETGLHIVSMYHWGIIPTTDNHRLLPEGLLVKFEGWASQCRLLRPLAQNVIIVCAKGRASSKNASGMLKSIRKLFNREICE